MEDWGCGLAWYKLFHEGGKYTGVDESQSNFADVVCKLESHVTATPGLLMRHVLEHNRNWRQVLERALVSFTHRMCLIVFTPLESSDRVLTIEGVPIPDIALKESDLRAMLQPFLVKDAHARTHTRYGWEWIFYLQVSP